MGIKLQVLTSTLEWNNWSALRSGRGNDQFWIKTYHTNGMVMTAFFWFCLMSLRLFRVQWQNDFEWNILSKVLLEKLTVAHLLKKLLYAATRRFITVFTTARHWSLYYDTWIYIFTSLFFKIHLNIILPSTPRSSRWNLPSFHYFMSFVLRTRSILQTMDNGHHHCILINQSSQYRVTVCLQCYHYTISFCDTGSGVVTLVRVDFGSITSSSCS
jgi:hypothetical protein